MARYQIRSKVNESAQSYNAHGRLQLFENGGVIEGGY